MSKFFKKYEYWILILIMVTYGSFFIDPLTMVYVVVVILFFYGKNTETEIKLKELEEKIKNISSN